MSGKWAEEKEGPLQRPRAGVQNLLVSEPDEQLAEPDDVSRPATESLLHTQRIAAGLFDFSVGAHSSVSPNSPFQKYCDGQGSGDSADAFDVLAGIFKFQESSVKNQRDNAVSMLASRLSRAVGREIDNMVSDQDAGLVLGAFHAELLSNYSRWCCFLGVNPVILDGLFAPSQKSKRLSIGLESALMLLIWGEAGNLRFCPEFLCFLFHKMGLLTREVVDGRTADLAVPASYLDDVIVPAYDLLAVQLVNVGHGAIDHSNLRNYDDFNEIFWQEDCLRLTVGSMFTEKSSLKKSFQKTFVERQSWLVPIFSFWRVHTLHIMGLHLMVVGAVCQEDLGTCDFDMLGATVITLYVCSLVRDLWDVQQALYVFAGHRGPFGQLALNLCRAALKTVILLLLVVTYVSDTTIFPWVAAIFFLVAAASELVMLTEFWWGIASYGKWGASATRSCSAGGFAACCPSRLRQLGWSVVGSMCGINSVNLYTQVHSLPPITKRVRYILFWAVVLATKISFSYFVVIKKMTVATSILYSADSTLYSFGSLLGTYEDEHNYINITALWLGSGLIYFLDMQIWFVVWANIAAAVEGVRRRVGEINSSAQVVRAFTHLHKELFSYMRKEMSNSTLHTRFAHVWNEIVDAMREEDIISNQERMQLRYFLIQLRGVKANTNPKHTKFAPSAMEDDWGPLFTLLPEFLMSGAVQRAVATSAKFAKDISEDLREIKREEARASNSFTSTVVQASGAIANQRKLKVTHLRGLLATRQYQFLQSSGNDEVTSEMIRQLSATTFILVDALCRTDTLSRSFWNLHRALFAADVNQDGKGIGRTENWIRDLYATKKDKPAARVVAAFSKKVILFSVHKFPDFITAMVKLLKTLNEHVSTPNWNKNVYTDLNMMVTALLALLETSAESTTDSSSAQAFLSMLKGVRTNLEAWKTDFAEGGGVGQGARPFKETAKEFLRRAEVFLSAPANSQPGLIKGAEARRRIQFFVNSLFVEQPKPTRVMKMPSLTTLTPYYNEDVVLSLESLREETQDGVTVLEYLRSIYPDEFENFVERMKVASESKSKAFPFKLEVMKSMLAVLLDTESDEDTSSTRDSVLKKVKKKIVAKVKNQRADDDMDPIDHEDIVKALKVIDLDEITLQLQLWASNRGQTLARTVRGVMYYSQAVRLLAVVENIEEFQPKETGYMFGSSEKPDISDDVSDVDDGDSSSDNLVAFGGVVEAAQAQDQLHRRQNTGMNMWQRRRQTSSRGGGGVAIGTGNTPSHAAVSSSGGGNFRAFFNWNRRDDHEAALDEELAELDEGGALDAGRATHTSGSAPAVPPRPPPRSGTKAQPISVNPAAKPSGVVAPVAKGGKLKAAVKRAMIQANKEKEAAARRGRKKQREAVQMDDFQGFIQVKDPALNKVCVEYGLTAELAEAKYRYVVSCQSFGKMQKSEKKSDLQKAGHIKMLARMYHGLRIAHVDEVNGTFFSVLSKHAGTGGDDMVEEYRVRLPGQILIGEGKPNNQNHALIFTRGEAIQAIDMNQDAVLEDAIKIRQVMQEFKFARGGVGTGKNIGRIVGFREHVFTHDVSAVANFFSLQELNFVSATQRALDNPLHVRFHYGHPDVFDRMSAITLGGISKSCKGIHLSEDIFAGFNYILRGGESTQADYIQVSKGRDTGVSQVTGFTAKISMGNGMQARSREVYRLAAQFDMFRLLSFYYSSVGGFMNQVLLMVAVFFYVYAKLYIAFDPDFSEQVDDEVLDAISSQFLFQLGFLLILPIPLLLAVEQGIQRAVTTLINILLRLAPFFFIFSAGTNAHYVNSAVMTGKANYQATGRGFVIAHEYFVDMFPLYLVSHFNPAFELLVALIVYALFATSGYFLETFSVYLLVIGLLWTPLVFNPNGLDFTYASQDFTGWLEWMNSPVDDPKKGWLSWYSKELEETRQWLPFGKKIEASLRRTRLLILVYGFLTAIGEDYDDAEEWPGSAVVGTAMLMIVALIMCSSWIRAVCCPKKPLKYGFLKARWARLWNMFSLVAVIIGIIVLACFEILQSAKQFFFYVLSFVILVYYTSQVVVLFSKDALRNIAPVRIAFKTVHMTIGLVIMVPVLVMSFFPLFVDLQTRMLFNEDFSQRFSIAKIFARQSQRSSVEKQK